MALVKVFEDIVHRVPLKTIQRAFRRYGIKAGSSVNGTMKKVKK